MNEAQIIQTLMSAGAGLFGVGVGVGLFRGLIKQIQGVIKQLQKDLDRVQYKQIKLRGEDNGGLPMYVTRDTCISMRKDCERINSNKIEVLREDVKTHTRTIRSLENFARWWMQKEGLNIDEVNRILNNRAIT